MKAICKFMASQVYTQKTHFNLNLIFWCFYGSWMESNIRIALGKTSYKDIICLKWFSAEVHYQPFYHISSVWLQTLIPPNVHIKCFAYTVFITGLNSCSRPTITINFWSAMLISTHFKCNYPMLSRCKVLMHCEICCTFSIQHHQCLPRCVLYKMHHLIAYF